MEASPNFPVYFLKVYSIGFRRRRAGALAIIFHTGHLTGHRYGAPGQLGITRLSLYHPSFGSEQRSPFSHQEERPGYPITGANRMPAVEITPAWDCTIL